MNYFVLPIFFFFGSYFFFLNFPSIAEKLHQQPLYLEDLVMARGGQLDRTFQRWYSVIMNFILALLFAAFADYVILKGVRTMPVTQMLAIIGGNISLYMKTQDSVGKALLSIMHMLKTSEEDKGPSIEIELVETATVDHASAVTGSVSTADDKDSASRI